MPIWSHSYTFVWPLTLADRSACRRCSVFEMWYFAIRSKLLRACTYEEKLDEGEDAVVVMVVVTVVVVVVVWYRYRTYYRCW